MKKLACIIIVSVLVVAWGLIGTSDAKGPEHRWKWAHIYPTDSDHHKRSEAIAKEVYEKTNGRIKLEIYPAAQLGDWIELHEQLMRGALEFALIPVSTLYDPRLNFTWMPYLATDYETAKKSFGPGGVFYDTLDKMLAEQGIALLGVWSQGLAGVSLTKMPVSPGDPNVQKGLKVRVPGLQAFKVSWEALGYIPTPIPLTDTYTAIQTGVVDGEAGGGPYQAWAQFRDVTKCWVQYNDYFEMWQFGASKKIWDSMSKGDQEIFRSAVTKQSIERFDYCKEEDAKYMKELEKAGAKIIMLSPEELKACADKVRKEGWPKLEETIGKALMDRINSAVGVK